MLFNWPINWENWLQVSTTTMIWALREFPIKYDFISLRIMTKCAEILFEAGCRTNGSYWLWTKHFSASCKIMEIWTQHGKWRTLAEFRVMYGKRKGLKGILIKIHGYISFQIRILQIVWTRKRKLRSTDYLKMHKSPVPKLSDLSLHNRVWVRFIKSYTFLENVSWSTPGRHVLPAVMQLKGIGIPHSRFHFARRLGKDSEQTGQQSPDVNLLTIILIWENPNPSE